MILILGASGNVGSSLFQSFKTNKIPSIRGNEFSSNRCEVKGTYYKSFDNSLLYFDIAVMQLSDLDIDLSKITHIVICTAFTTKLDEVYQNWNKDPKTGYFVNITKLIEIFDFCFKNKIIPVFLSSDGVFDGKKGNYSENNKPNPVHRYGFIKYELEKYLIESKQKYLILRFGKVISKSIDDKTLFTEIILKLINNEEQQLAIDEKMTPVYIEDLVYFIRVALLNNLKGILHLASMGPMNRYDFAMQGAKYFNIKNPNIYACKINSLGLSEKRPKMTDLNVEIMKKLIRFQLRPLEYFFQLIRKEITVS